MPSSDNPLGGDPPIANRFLFEVDGVEIGIFTEVSGLEVTVDYRGDPRGRPERLRAQAAGPDDLAEHRLSSAASPQSDALFDWMTKSSGEGFAGNGNKLKRATGGDHRDRLAGGTGCGPGSSTGSSRCAGRARTSRSTSNGTARGGTRDHPSRVHVEAPRRNPRRHEHARRLRPGFAARSRRTWRTGRRTWPPDSVTVSSARLRRPGPRPAGTCARPAPLGSLASSSTRFATVRCPGRSRCGPGPARGRASSARAFVPRSPSTAPPRWWIPPVSAASSVGGASGSARRGRGRAVPAPRRAAGSRSAPSRAARPERADLAPGGILDSLISTVDRRSTGWTRSGPPARCSASRTRRNSRPRPGVSSAAFSGPRRRSSSRSPAVSLRRPAALVAPHLRPVRYRRRRAARAPQRRRAAAARAAAPATARQRPDVHGGAHGGRRRTPTAPSPARATRVHVAPSRRTIRRTRSSAAPLLGAGECPRREPMAGASLRRGRPWRPRLARRSQRCTAPQPEGRAAAAGCRPERARRRGPASARAGTPASPDGPGPQPELGAPRPRPARPRRPRGPAIGRRPGHVHAPVIAAASAAAMSAALCRRPLISLRPPSRVSPSGAWYPRSHRR